MKSAFLCPYGITVVSINTGHTNVSARRWKNKKVKLIIVVGYPLKRNISKLSPLKVEHIIKAIEI